MTGLQDAYAGPVDLSAVPSPDEAGRAAWRAGLADALYGPVPPRPDTLRFTRAAIPGENAERLRLSITCDGRRFQVDAALWLPPGADGPVPLVAGLDFIGPAGMMFGQGFPLDPAARVHSRPEYGATGGRLTDGLRGVSAYRWPVPMLLDAGFGVLVSCYGSWVPDDAEAWAGHGLAPLLNAGTGAISLWAWALSRLLDVAGALPEVDAGRLSVAGHSRLGKAALWAAAHDPRVAAVFASASGCGGAAPAAHPVGETLAEMAARFPHWLRPGFDASASRRFDQQHLLAAIAPRGVFLTVGRDDLWADPVGSYLALGAASAAWAGPTARPTVWPSVAQFWASDGPVERGATGFRLRDGGHDLLPADWRGFIAWFNRMPPG